MDAGHSGTPQLRKLGISPGTRVSLLQPDPGWHFAEPTHDVIFVATGTADVILLFARTMAEVRLVVPELGERIKPSGALWIAWPRRAAGHLSELGDQILRDLVLPTGLVDVKVAAIDPNWSGLKFVWRTELR